MPKQLTDIIRIIPVGQPYNRDSSPSKDQRFKNCYVETASNPFSQTKKHWLVKRPGFSEHLNSVGITTYPAVPPGTPSVGYPGEGSLSFDGDATTTFTDSLLCLGTPGLTLDYTSDAFNAPTDGHIVSVKHKKGEKPKVITWKALGWNGTTYSHELKYWLIEPDGSWTLDLSAYVHHIGVYSWAQCGYTIVADYADDSFVLGYPAATSKALLVTRNGSSIEFYDLHYGTNSNYRNFVSTDYVAYSTRYHDGWNISERSGLASRTPTMGTWGGYYGYGITGPTNAECAGHLARIKVPGEIYRGDVLIDNNYIYAVSFDSPNAVLYRIEHGAVLTSGGDFDETGFTYDDYTVSGGYYKVRAGFGLAPGSLIYDFKSTTPDEHQIYITKDFSTTSLLAVAGIAQEMTSGSISSAGKCGYVLNNEQYLEIYDYGGYP